MMPSMDGLRGSLSVHFVHNGPSRGRPRDLGLEVGCAMPNQAIYLTPKGRKKLEQELEHLRNVKRQEVAKRLHEAMEDGELIENAEYEAAKNEQAFVEGRILELEHTLASAQEIRKGRSKDQVPIGSTVVIQEDGSSQETYTIVGAAEANPEEGLL